MREGGKGEKRKRYKCGVVEPWNRSFPLFPLFHFSYPYARLHTAEQLSKSKKLTPDVGCKQAALASFGFLASLDGRRRRRGSFLPRKTSAAVAREGQYGLSRL